MIGNGKPRSDEWRRAYWFATLVKRSLALTDDADLALRSAQMAIEAQPLPPEDIELAVDPIVTRKQPEVALAFDIFNTRAQGILNRAMTAANRLSGRARRELEAALRSRSIQQISRKLDEWGERWKGQMAALLTTTQLAAVLAGMRQVASSVPVSPPLGLRDAALPASLPPEDAIELLDRLRDLSYDEQQQAIYELPPDQQAYARTALLAEGSRQPPAPPIVPPRAPSEGEGMHWPVIDEATRLLQEKNLVTRPEFDQLDAAARAKSFTVAGVDSLETLDKIRTAIAEQVASGVDVREFASRVMAEVEPGTFLSSAHMENVLRTNVQQAFTDGTNKILDHPFVRSGFPYAAYEPIHDDRVREEHLALEELGIDGSNIYRRDDPVFMKFQPPWDYQCRCSWTPLSVRRAAELGVVEAQRWLDAGREPSPPAFVSQPPFEPPPGFHRSLLGVPLSIRLSAEPLDHWEYTRNDLAAEILAELVDPDGRPKRRRRKRRRRRGRGRAFGAHFGDANPWAPAGRSRKGQNKWTNRQTGETRYQPERPSPSEGADASTASSESSQANDAKRVGLIARVKNNVARFAAIADKIPGVGHVKRGVQKTMSTIHKGLAARYGEKAATAIMTSGSLGGYGVMAVAQAMVGFPGIPVVNDLISIAAHTAVAEFVLQAGRLKTAVGLSSEEDAIRADLINKLAEGLKPILTENYKAIAEAVEGGAASEEIKAVLAENSDILEAAKGGASLSFDDDHPRGQPDNAGQFAEKPGGKKKEKSASDPKKSADGLRAALEKMKRPGITGSGAEGQCRVYTLAFKKLHPDAVIWTADVAGKGDEDHFWPELNGVHYDLTRDQYSGQENYVGEEPPAGIFKNVRKIDELPYDNLDVDDPAEAKKEEEKDADKLVEGASKKERTTEIIEPGNSELASLREQAAKLFPEGPRRDEALHALSPSKWDVTVTMKDADGKLKGVAQIWKDPDTARAEGVDEKDGPFIRIRNMGTAESGIGRDLVEQVKQYAASKNAGIYLDSLEASRPFYEKLGFRSAPGGIYYLSRDDVKQATQQK